MELKIRPARMADASEIAEYNSRLAWETEERRLEPGRILDGVRALMADPTKGIYYVAEVPAEGQAAIAGQLLITYEWSDWRNGNFWWIQSVYVSERFRGMGIFRALYQHVHNLALSDSGVCGLRLYVEAHNTRAQQAYARLGMQETGYRLFELDFRPPQATSAS